MLENVYTFKYLREEIFGHGNSEISAQDICNGAKGRFNEEVLRTVNGLNSKRLSLSCGWF